MASPAILYSRRNEDLPALIAEISLEQANEVLVVVPTSSMLFHSALNVKLLKEECVRMGKKLLLSTQDPAGAAFAKNLGIPVQKPTEGEKFFEEWSRAPARDTADSLHPAHRPSADPPVSMHAHTSFLQEQKKHVPGQRRAMDIISPSPVARPAQKAVVRELPQAVEMMPYSAPVVGDKAEDGKESEKETRITYDSDIQQQPLASERTGRFIGIIAGSVVLVLAVAAAVMFVKSAAVVTVLLKEEPLEFEMDVTARTDISAVEVAKAVVPLQRLRVEEATTREFPATGNRDVTNKARGRITVYNTFGVTPQPLMATTRFLSELGKVFRTPKAVVIPGGHMEKGKLTPGKLAIEVVADQAGEAYNIPPSRFSIPGFAGSPRAKAFYGISEELMTGGFMGKTNVVEKKDIEEARATLVPLEKARLEQVLRAKLPSGLAFIDGALQVATESADASPREGEPGSTFALTVRTGAEALLFREQDVLSVVEPGITGHLGSAYTVVPDTRKVSYTIKERDQKLGRMVFTTLVSLRTRPALDAAELSRNLAGKKLSEVKTFFGGETRIEKADLSLRPFWARSLPQDASRIMVKISSTEAEK